MNIEYRRINIGDIVKVKSINKIGRVEGFSRIPFHLIDEDVILVRYENTEWTFEFENNVELYKGNKGDNLNK